MVQLAQPLPYSTPSRRDGLRLSKLSAASAVLGLLAFPFPWLEPVMHLVERPGALDRSGVPMNVVVAFVLFAPVAIALVVSGVACYRTRHGQRRLRGSLAADFGLFLAAISLYVCARAYWLIVHGVH